jgi:hypothetical protein
VLQLKLRLAIPEAREPARVTLKLATPPVGRVVVGDVKLMLMGAAEMVRFVLVALAGSPSIAAVIVTVFPDAGIVVGAV